MKKRITALALAALMVMGTVAAAAGAEKTITVTPMGLNVNGQVVIPTKSDGTPAEVFAYEGATYAPLRYLTELNGNQVVWDKNDPNTAKITTGMTYADTIAWDGQYDVVVVGFGGAGASAAISASDAGANTLVLEKAPEGKHGGNTRVCGQYILDFTSQEGGETYLKTLRGSFSDPSDEYISTMVTRMLENEKWLENLGAKSLFLGKSCEYPGFAGGDSVQMLMVESTNLYDNFNSNLWRLLERNVKERDTKNLDIWYESPALHLIQDPVSKTIIGVQANHDGKTVNIRANNGIILACGGFENNQNMVQDYLHREEVFPHGTTYNTGDGITMALEVNADLWHMGAMSGPFLTFKGFGEDSEQVPFLNMAQNVTKGTSVINVAGDAKRFCNETERSRHGFVQYNDEWRNQVQFNTMYAIFDKTTLLAGPLYPTFSKDNSAEIKSGLIIEANSIEALANKIGLDADTLAATVKEYNDCCAAGKDPYFNRDPKQMTPIKNGPFYAIELVCGMVNTQGGPRRNIECQVLDTQGNPIPNLYSAGELGSMYSNNYNGGGNIAECLVTGRVAGANAATVKSALPSYSPKIVSSNLVYTVNSADNTSNNEISLSANEYLGSGIGMGGDLQVKVTMKDGKIAKVEVLDNKETPGIGTKAIEALPDAIVKAGSTNVDNVSGATITSKAIKEAVADALSQVK